MLFVVVAVVMALVVVSPLLASVVRFLGATGTMAPPYHLNHGIIFIKVVVLIMLVMVATRTLDSVVVFSVLIYRTLLLPLTIVVLLYHLNQ